MTMGTNTAPSFATQWAKVDPEIRERAVSILRAELHPDVFVEIRRRVAERGSHNWLAPGFHFSGGMMIRNLLRQNGLTDDLLPAWDEYYGEGTNVRNWDDYYVQALEEAANSNG